MVAGAGSVLTLSCKCLCSSRGGSKHTHSSGGQGRQHGLGPTKDSMAEVMALAVNRLFSGCFLSLQMCALQLKLMTGIRLVSHRGKTGVASSKCVHSGRGHLGVVGWHFVLM